MAHQQLMDLQNDYSNVADQEPKKPSVTSKKPRAKPTGNAPRPIGGAKGPKKTKTDLGAAREMTSALFENHGFKDEEAEYNCPITKERMREPLIITTCGHTFEKKPIEMWVSKKKSCPKCRQKVKDGELISNFSMKTFLTRKWKASK